MLSEIFVMFYAKVRVRQYLHYIINIVHFKNNYLPILIYKNDKLMLMNDISSYYENEEGLVIDNAISHDIVYNPRTYLYSIDKTGNYIFEFNTNDKDKFQAAVKELNRKIYKTIVKITADEEDMDDV